MSTEPRDEIERRWQSLGRGWEPLLRCFMLSALIAVWVRTPAQTLRSVAEQYIEFTRHDLSVWLGFDPVLAARYAAMLPTWCSEAPNIRDSATWEHGEARRLCAMVHELRRRAFAEGRRYQERNLSPVVILKPVPNA